MVSALRQWFRTGRCEEEFWQSTPRIINLALVAYNEGAKIEERRLSWLSWNIEALARQTKLPTLRSFLGLKEVVQSDKEMAAALSSWVAQHNANWALAEELKKRQAEEAQ